VFAKHVKGPIKNCIDELRGTVPKPNSANSRHLFGDMSFYNNAADKFRLSEHWSENISMQVRLVSSVVINGMLYGRFFSGLQRATTMWCSCSQHLKFSAGNCQEILPTTKNIIHRHCNA